LRSIFPFGLLIQAGGFALISAIGLGLDLMLFFLLVSAGLAPGFANLISASAAVTFVYLTSTKRIFSHDGRVLEWRYLAYISYQASAVALASWAIDVIVSAWNIGPMIAKVGILPVTFSTNFLFMRLLTAGIASRK
jgi:putative flippase GtrA